jgi:hypothetical protein
MGYIIFSDAIQVVLKKDLRKFEKMWNTQFLGLYRVVMAVHVCLKYLGCICIDGIGTITDVAGNINSAKYIDIFDNIRWPIVGKLENNQWSFQDGNAPVHRTDTIAKR